MAETTGFNTDNISGHPGFVYTDGDGDRLKVWSYSDGELRMEPSSSIGVAIHPDDVKRFKEELARVTRRKCIGCNGEGCVE